MELSEQFYHSFFYTFLVGVVLSFLAIAIFSIIFTNTYIDKKTGDNILELEKQFAKVNLNSMNIIITSSITKIQQSLNELISSYIKAANIVKNNENIHINLTNNNFFKGLLSLTPSFLEENKHLMEYIAYWVIDEFTDETNVKLNSTEEKQLYSFSSIIQNIYSTFSSSNYSSICYYFYFDSSELFISYPLIYDYEREFLEVMLNYEDNPKWCTDKNGNIYKHIK
jgi:transcription-repair coupling factor (superfamily II helicase)